MNLFSKILLDQLIIKCFIPLPNALTNSLDSDSPDSPDYGSPDSVNSPDSGSSDLYDSSGFGSLLNQAVNRLIQKRTKT